MSSRPYLTCSLFRCWFVCLNWEFCLVVFSPYAITFSFFPLAPFSPMPPFSLFFLKWSGDDAWIFLSRSSWSCDLSCFLAISIESRRSYRLEVRPTAIKKWIQIAHIGIICKIRDRYLKGERGYSTPPMVLLISFWTYPLFRDCELVEVVNEIDDLIMRKGLMGVVTYEIDLVLDLLCVNFNRLWDLQGSKCN